MCSDVLQQIRHANSCQVTHRGEAAQMSSLLQILRQLQLPGAAHPHPQRRQTLHLLLLPENLQTAQPPTAAYTVRMCVCVCDLLKNALLHLLQGGARALSSWLRLCSHLASFLKLPASVLYYNPME